MCRNVTFLFVLLGKDDELPKKKKGKIQIQPEIQPAVLNLTHLVNGQNSARELDNTQAIQKTGQRMPPETVQESSTNHRRRSSSLEKKPSLRQQRPVPANVQSGLPKNDDSRKKPGSPRRGSPNKELRAEADTKQNHNAAANQNSNAISNTRREFVPRWNKPSDIKIIEKTTQLSMEIKSQVTNHVNPEAPPSPGGDMQLLNIKQKMKVWDVDEGKRGSNASQYDNVPAADLETENSVGEGLEIALFQSPKTIVCSSSSRKLTEKTSSPPKISNSYVLGSQPRPPRFSSQSDGLGFGHLKPLPPSYSNPPVYDGNSPKHVPDVVCSSFISTQHPQGNRTNSPGRPYVPSLPSPTFPDKPHTNYSSLSHQNLVVTPSSRIEVPPVEDYASNPRPPKGIRFVIPPVDYLPDNREWPNLAYMYRQDAYGQSWSQDGSRRSHFSNLKKYPHFQSMPIKDHNLPTVSVDSPIRYRTSSTSEERGSPPYPFPGPPGPAHHYRHQADGLSMHESVLLWEAMHAHWKGWKEIQELHLVW